MVRLAFVALLLVGCGDGEKSVPANGTCGESSPTQAVVDVKVVGQPRAGVRVLSHDAAGTALDETTTDEHGCAIVASAEGALVTVAFEGEGYAPFLLTTLAPTKDELLVHGPLRFGEPEPIAGTLRVEAGTVEPYVAPMPGDSVGFGYDLGCTPIGCVSGRIDALPASIDIPARFVADDGTFNIKVAATMSGLRCCDSHGQPYSLHDERYVQGDVRLVDGAATVTSALSTTCHPTEGLDDCVTDWWPYRWSPNNEVPYDEVFGELETGKASHSVNTLARPEDPTLMCPADPASTNFACSWLQVPPGLTPDHARVTVRNAQGDSPQLVRLTVDRSDGPIDVAPLPPALTINKLFQDATHHEASWTPPTSFDSDLVVLALSLYGVVDMQSASGRWYVALPPTSTSVRLPDVNNLPVTTGSVVYVDSDAISQFDEIAPAGVHLDTDQLYIDPGRWILVDPSASKIRVTAAVELFE